MTTAVRAQGASKSPTSPFADFIEPFLASAGTLAAGSKNDYRYSLLAFDTFTQHMSLREALTVEHVSAWVVSKLEAGRSFAAKNSAMHLRRFSRWACDYHYLCDEAGRHVLLHFVAPKVKPKPRRPLTQAELEKIWAWLPNTGAREAALLRLLLATGALRNVARAFLREDFRDDAVHGAIVVVRDEDPVRLVRLDDETASAVRTYLADAQRRPDPDEVPEALLLNRYGRMYSYFGWGSMTDRLSDEIEIATGLQWTPDLMRVTAEQRESALLSDHELSDACTALVNDPLRFYQALSAAFQILEKRVREASGASSSLHTVELMRYAFGPPQFRLQLSTNDNARRGMLELFTGLMTYYRNPVAHGDFPALDQRGVRQIILWVDHLLALVDRARSRHGTAP